MNITKLGHCCLVLDIDGKKIMTDPGNYTEEKAKAMTGINVMLITHEHQDHFHMNSIEGVLKNNPGIVVVSNSAVAKLLAEKNIACTVVGDGQSAEVDGIIIEGFGKDHAPIYGTLGLVENTGYMVAGKFYFPGDSFHAPGKPVDILALPLAGPWLKLSEAIDFAKKIKPRVAFPVHDGAIIPNSSNFTERVLNTILNPDGITFVPFPAGESKDFGRATM